MVYPLLLLLPILILVLPCNCVGRQARIVRGRTQKIMTLKISMLTYQSYKILLQHAHFFRSYKVRIDLFHHICLTSLKSVGRE